MWQYLSKAFNVHWKFPRQILGAGEGGYSKEEVQKWTALRRLWVIFKVDDKQSVSGFLKCFYFYLCMSILLACMYAYSMHLVPGETRREHRIP